MTSNRGIINTLGMRRLRSLLVGTPIVFMALVGALSVYAGDSKPKETPTESLSLDFKKINYTSSRIDGSAGPTITLQGGLHIISQTLLSDAGVPVGFTLHGNLANASASSIDGSEAFVAVGASEGIPAECLGSEACAPPFWMFTFRLITQGSDLKPSLLVQMAVNTQYAENGMLVNACVVGQPGCQEIGIVP